MTKLDDNIARATGFLARFARDGVLNHIGGQAVPAASGKTFEIISPVDLKPLAQVARGDAADIDAAAKAAHAAFATWSAMPGADRRKILHRIADGIEARADEIAMVECMDTGQALRFMSKAAIRGAENFRFFADKATEARDGRTLHAPGQVNMTSRSALGPVGIITPWNTPFMLSTWKIAPALAAATEAGMMLAPFCAAARSAVRAASTACGSRLSRHWFRRAICSCSIAGSTVRIAPSPAVSGEASPCCQRLTPTTTV